ncbi:MAG: TolC family protein [Pyrinomonadaceae bacterium]|nr:TolC family protein [Pyrinomonadaceae bacterium]
MRLNFIASLCCLLLAATNAFAQQSGAPAPSSGTFTPAPSSNTTNAPAGQQSAPPASSGAPSGNNTPQGQTITAPTNARPLTPSAQTQQSVQPQPQGSQQQGNAEAQTPAPNTTPTSSVPTTDTLPSVQGANQPGVTSQPQNPQGGTQTIPAPQVSRPPGRESVPSAAPESGPLSNVPTVAPDFRAEPSAPLPPLERVGVSMSDQRPLALREAITMALENNKDIEVSRQNVRIAEFDLRGAQGVYDPRLTSLSYYERTETPTASFLSGGQGGAVTQSSYTGTARFEGLVPKGGGGYRVDFSSLRLTTDNQFASLNPQYPTALTFSYTQPLLRGFRFDINRRGIEIARRNLSLTDAQFRQRATEVIASVQRAYWDLVFALRNLQIQRDAVQDARRQLEHNRRLVQEGILAPIDVVAAEAQVSGFEQSVYTALEDVGRTENSLKNLIAVNREAVLWQQSLVPVDPIDLQPSNITLPEALGAAMQNRQELRQSDVARQINEIDQRYLREQTKPQVDLVASYGVSGLAGSLSTNTALNPFTGTNEQLRQRINELSLLSGLPGLPEPPAQTFPEVLVGGFGQSLTNLLANRFNNFRVGVQLNLPIRNRTAQAQLGRSLVEAERVRTQREGLEQLIEVDVRNALQAVRTSESRLRAAAAARSASEQQYASEGRKFDVGQSTIFLVLERQTALTTARGNELRAQTELNKANAELQRATGNALEANSVSVRVR